MACYGVDVAFLTANVACILRGWAESDIDEQGWRDEQIRVYLGDSLCQSILLLFGQICSMRNKVERHV
jgi:hypothetical protein